MEAFKAFATFSLVDMLSSPLQKMKAALNGIDMSAANLSQRMGKLALTMAPVAVAAGVVVGAFSCATAKAMDFEAAMADVGRMAHIQTAEGLSAMGESVKDLAGKIPIATENLANIMAFAAKSGVAKESLAEFTGQAAKMGLALNITGEQAGQMMADWRNGMNLTLPRTYALADAVNYLSENMNAQASEIGEIVQRHGALAAQVGLSETQTAALSAAFLSTGANARFVNGAMQGVLTTLSQGNNMSKTAATAFAKLGLSTKQVAQGMQTDAQGTITKVFQALANKPKANQLGLLTDIFGESSVGAIAPLLADMGKLKSAFGLVADSAAYAGSVENEFAAQSTLAKNALQLLQNKTKNLSLSVGSIFLPAVSWAAEKLGTLADAARWIVDTPFGQWLIKIVAGLSGVVLGVTAVSTGIWGIGKIAPIVSKALLPLKAALFGLGWPVYAVIGAVGLLYLAYKKNFGGMADTLNRWWNNISLVFRGVVSVFATLKGSTGEIRGELARDIKAAGLEGLVTTVAKIVYRIKEFFRGVSDSINFEPAVKVLVPVASKIEALFTRLGNVIARIMGTEVTTASESFYLLGKAIGGVLSWGFEALATAVTVFANCLSIAVDLVDWLVCLLTGDLAGACAAGERMWDSLVDSFMSIADLLGIGDLLREAWNDAMAYLGSINLFESGARILDTLQEGIASKFASFKESITGFFADIRDLLPFSDAKKGPFSDLTLSGSRLMTTLAEGAEKGVGTLENTINGAFGGIAKSIGDWWDGLFAEPQTISVAPAVDTPLADAPFSDTALLTALDGAATGVAALHNSVSSTFGGMAQSLGDWWDGLFAGSQSASIAPKIPSAPVYSAATEREEPTRRGENGEGARTSYTIHIGNIALQGVEDGKGFLQSLDDAIAEYGGGGGVPA